MHVLVTGGAGYIGSHAVKALLGAGHRVTTLDNLSTGHRDAVPGGAFVRLDLADRAGLVALVAGRRFDAVMHFAASIRVGESVESPSAYYLNNTANTLHLLEAMQRARVRHLVYSSTAAVFGEPAYVPIDEAHPRAPINPYGASKKFIEDALADYGHAYGLAAVSLRYFNAAGADPDGELGPRHDPVTHLVPAVLRAALGVTERFRLFGTDHPTPDGTCIRDFVHVTDLATAHLAALDWLAGGGGTAAFNLGSGTGYSVREVLSAAERITGRAIPTEFAPRRAGDPARLVADPSAAQRVLGWRPRHARLETIVAHAWGWEQHLAREGAGTPERRLLRHGGSTMPVTGVAGRIDH